MQTYGKLVEIWGNITSLDKETAPLDATVYRNRIADYFHVGPYYYYVFDVPNTAFEFISDNMLTILGYDPNSITVTDIIEKIHPDDIPFFIQCENATVEFAKTISPKQLLNYKISYDYRIRKSTGEYIRILQQVVTIEIDLETGDLIKTLGIHTDISHIKSVEQPQNESILSFIGLNGEKSYYKTYRDLFVHSNEIQINLSPRQKQIVSCLMNGMNSQEIADSLFISKNTVDTHRRKILDLFKVKNTTQLILKVSKSGWL